MPSTFDSLLRLELQADGENNTTWGQKTNTNLSLLADAIAGRVVVTVAGSGDLTLSTANASADQSRPMIIEFTGVPTDPRNIIIPGASKVYFTRASSDVSQVLTIKTAAGDGFELNGGENAILFCDGTSVQAGDFIPGEGSIVDRQVFTSSGTWNKPVGLPTRAMAYVQVWAAGGGGGTGANASGGGGGAYAEGWFLASGLSSSYSATVGAGGVAGNPGTTGGASSFGAILGANGGAGGTTSGAGGGGGGVWSSGATGGTGGRPNGGTADSPIGGDSAMGGGGGGAAGANIGGAAIWGGGGGGGSAASSSLCRGGRSTHGGGGGGGSASSDGGQSFLGGNGGNAGSNGTAPAGGGGARANGARGEIRVTIFT